MTEPVGHEQLPPPPPGKDAAARSARNPAHVAERDEPGQGRQDLGPLLIGIAAKFLVAMAIPIGIVIVLAFLAQHVISSH